MKHLICGMGFATLAALLTGCSGEKSTPQAAGAPAADPGKPADEKKFTRPAGVLGVHGQTKSMLLLREIGLACKVEDVSKLPRTVEELKAILKDSPQARRPVETGEFVLVSNAQLTSESLFMYERDPDQLGNRMVLMGDGSVHKKTADEFAEMMKALKR